MTKAKSIDLGLRGPSLMLAIADAIKQEPLRYDQSNWETVVRTDISPELIALEWDEDAEFWNNLEWNDIDIEDELAHKASEARERGETFEYDCGSAYCISGWAGFLSGVLEWHYSSHGRMLLEIDSEEAAAFLFDAGWTPAGAQEGDSVAQRALLAAEALRNLAYGASLEDVTDSFFVDVYSDDPLEATTLDHLGRKRAWFVKSLYGDKAIGAKAENKG